MDDIMNALNAAMNDPAAMEQLSNIAASIMNNSDTGTGTAPSQPAPARPSQPSPQIPQGISPDISKLIQLSGTLASAGANDKNIAFLLALKPLLKAENGVKIDRLVKIFRLLAAYPLLKDSGIIGGDLFG